MKAEADAAIDSSTGALYTTYHADAVRYIFQADDDADNAAVTSNTAADLFVLEYMKLTKHRMARAVYKGGCVIGTAGGKKYFDM